MKESLGPENLFGKRQSPRHIGIGTSSWASIDNPVAVLPRCRKPFAGTVTASPAAPVPRWCRRPARRSEVRGPGQDAHPPRTNGCRPGSRSRRPIRWDRSCRERCRLAGSAPARNRPGNCPGSPRRAMAGTRRRSRAAAGGRAARGPGRPLGPRRGDGRLPVAAGDVHRPRIRAGGPPSSRTATRTVQPSPRRRPLPTATTGPTICVASECASRARRRGIAARRIIPEAGWNRNGVSRG
jgi:hypothetical protein